MNKSFILVAMLLLGSATAAVAQDVAYNFAQDTDFSKFKTYKWVNLKDADNLDQLTQRQVMAAVDTELAAKGIRKTDSDSADLYIAIQTAINTSKQFVPFSPGWGYSPNWGRSWQGYGAAEMKAGQDSTISVGQLDLDIYDTANKNVVWRGRANNVFDAKAKPHKQQQSITIAVNKLLDYYPPPSKK